MDPIEDDDRLFAGGDDDDDEEECDEVWGPYTDQDVITFMALISAHIRDFVDDLELGDTAEQERQRMHMLHVATYIDKHFSKVPDVLPDYLSESGD
jgi:hypothetical protein